MKYIYPCNDFFKNLPEVYSNQKDHKLRILKRQGLTACLGCAFIRDANAMETPANYALILREPEVEPIIVLFYWFIVEDEETISFIRITPDKFDCRNVS